MQQQKSISTLWLAPVGFFLLLVTGAAWFWFSPRLSSLHFQTALVSQGDLLATVSANHWPPLDWTRIAARPRARFRTVEQTGA